MKKIFFLAVITLLSNFAFSQIYQGQWMVGGNASFESAKFSESSGGTTSYFTLMPNAGYFFIDNLAGGLRVDLSSSKAEDQDANTTFAISPFLRYYFLPAPQKVNLFADVSYGIGSTGAGNKESFNQYAVMAGPAIFLTRNVALEFAVKYASMGGDVYGNNSRYNSFGVNAGFQVHLGPGR